MNWRKSSVAQRKTLYEAVKNTVDSKGKNFDQLIPEILGTTVSGSYRSTLRAGKYSKKKAVLMFDWLAQNNPSAAEAVSGRPIPKYKAPDRHQEPTSPILTIPLLDSNDETRFLFRSRAIPYIDPEDAFDQLDRFVLDERPFVWHVLTGSGGTGKSRLALEYAAMHATSGQVHIGFLSIESARQFDWSAWKPDGATFIVVDYAARESDLVSSIIQSLTGFENELVPVRLLLLEREITGSWFNKITQRGSADNILVERCWFEEGGTLEPPADVWPIIQFMLAECPERIPARKEAMSELERIDYQMRPLFAAFLGDAYARDQNPRNWNAYELVENVLEHEMRYWKHSGLLQAHINFCACATSTSGIPAEWIEDLSTHDMQGFWPEWQGRKTIETLSAIFGERLVDDVPPLEPDILGEVFYLEQWKSASRFERSRLLDFGSRLAPWYAEFLERLVSDFPDLPTDDLLSSFLKAPFEQYENVKFELTYNLITNLVDRYPERALKMFDEFVGLELHENQTYAVECILDSALNIIVGIEGLEADQALAIYRKLKKLIAPVPLIPENARLWSGVARSIIGKAPSADPLMFRPVLADALKLHRAYSRDEDIRQDACIALSNYVNLLDDERFTHAKHMLQVFRRLAVGDTAGEMGQAWTNILYHLFLLHLAKIGGENVTKESTTLALRQMTKLSPEFPDHKASVVKLFSEDLIDQE